MTESFPAIKVVQLQDAQPFYVAVLPAKEILRWAEVPRKKTDFRAGYQRQLDETRVKSITEFLSTDAKNIMPGAVIVALNQDKVDIEEVEGQPVCQLTIKEPDELDDEEAVAHVRDVLRSRLGPDDLAAINGIDVAEEEPDGEEADGDAEPNAEGVVDDDEDEDEANGADEDEPSRPPSYLAGEVAQLDKALEDLAALDQDVRQNYVDFARALLKPGLLIDGQHRVFGAKDVRDFDVPIPIVLVPGLSWSEQAFQFYVLNNKAVPLKPSQLRRVVSTSLSRQEIDELFGRLDQAGVTPQEAQWVYLMDEDPNSPFRELVDRGDGDLWIRENVAFGLVKVFMRMPAAYRNLVTDLPWWLTDPDDDRKLQRFYCFWRAVKDTYPTEWNRGKTAAGSQLMTKVGLVVLQDYILESLSQFHRFNEAEGKPSPLDGCDELTAMIRIALRDLPETFFSMEWQRKGLDTPDGREFLKTQMKIAVSNRGQRLGNQMLFRAVPGEG